jgi:hypothetical protein
LAAAHEDYDGQQYQGGSEEPERESHGRTIIPN